MMDIIEYFENLEKEIGKKETEKVKKEIYFNAKRNNFNWRKWKNKHLNEIDFSATNEKKVKIVNIWLGCMLLKTGE